MNQYYRVHAVIDLDAICHNIREVKRVVGESVKVMPVIKADGYGHGAVPLAEMFEGNALYLGLRCSMHGRSKNFKSTWNQETNLDSWLCFS